MKLQAGHNHNHYPEEDRWLLPTYFFLALFAPLIFLGVGLYITCKVVKEWARYFWLELRT